MSNTKSKSSQLGAIAQEAKVEVDRLRGEIAAHPGRLAEISRRLDTAKTEDTMRLLIQQRAKLQEDREINVAALRGAEISALRAESAYIRAQAEEAAPELPATIASDEDAKKQLDAATEAAKLAGKRRARIEKTVGDLTSRWQKLKLQADGLEGLTPAN
jgi:chromosome segregation ATPase